MSPEVLFYIIKLSLNGIVTFLAILLMSKIRDGAWASIIAGFLFGYAGIVYEIIVELGIISRGKILLFGIPLVSIIFTALPALFFIIGFIIMLSKKV